MEGTPKPREGSLKGYLFKDAKKNKVFVTDKPQPGAKTCQTNYITLAKKDGLSLVECELITGRTHQIRVQFASRKLPLVGDRKYGGKQTGVPLCLWSCSLSFPHPVTGKLLSFAQDAPWLEEWDKWFT